jgi:hypothetical protein
MEKETKFDVQSLPPKEAFYDDLSKNHISNEDYDPFMRRWLSNPRRL